MRRTQNRELFNPRRQQNRPPNFRTGAFGVVDNFLGGKVESTVIVGFHTDTNLGAAGHEFPQKRSPGFPWRRRRKAGIGGEAGIVATRRGGGKKGKIPEKRVERQMRW